MVARDRIVSEVTSGWQRRNPRTPAVASGQIKNLPWNSSTSREEDRRPVRNKSYSSYADAAPQNTTVPERRALATPSIDWQSRTGALLDHSAMLSSQCKSLSHISNMETMRQQQVQRHQDRHGQERSRELEAERSALRCEIERELAQEEDASGVIQEQVQVLQQQLAATEHRIELNSECVALREPRYQSGTLLDEVQRLLHKQSRELNSSRFQLTELVDNLYTVQNRSSPLHDMLESLITDVDDERASLNSLKGRLDEAQLLVNEIRLRHNQARHNVNRANELIRKRTSVEESTRLVLVDALEQEVLGCEDLLASLHQAFENAKADLQDAHAIPQHEAVIEQREQLLEQLTLSVAAIEDDMMKKEEALQQDQRCHWFQTCAEMVPSQPEFDVSDPRQALGY